MEYFGKFCFGVIAIVITTLLGGYAFMKLWDWFVVWTFHIQSLSLIQSIGLVFLWGYLKPKKKDEDELTMEKFTKQFIEAILWFGITLGLGWVITLFH